MLIPVWGLFLLVAANGFSSRQGNLLFSISAVLWLAGTGGGAWLAARIARTGRGALHAAVGGLVGALAAAAVTVTGSLLTLAAIAAS